MLKDPTAQRFSEPKHRTVTLQKPTYADQTGVIT